MPSKVSQSARAMEETVKLKLTAVLRQKARNDEAAETTRLANEKATRERQARYEEVRQRWCFVRKEIEAAVAVINNQISEAGMCLSITEKLKDDETPGLTQMIIILREDGFKKDREVVLNVSSLGVVQPVTLIPHTGPKIPDFDIAHADQSHYEALLVDFLDICVSQPQQTTHR